MCLSPYTIDFYLYDLIFTSHQQSFSYKRTCLPGMKQYIACINNVLAQGHKAVTPVPRCRVELSTTEPLRSYIYYCHKVKHIFYKILIFEAMKKYFEVWVLCTLVFWQPNLDKFD